MTEKPKFVRDATGLVREFGLLDAMAINLFASAPISSIAFIPLMISTLFPGANIEGVLTVGAVLAVFNGLVYSLLSAAMPRAGGDYVYNGRILHPAIGFMTSWGFTISQFLILAIGSSLTITTVVAPTLTTVGYQTSNQTMTSLGALFSTPLYVWGIGVLSLAVVMLIVGLPTRWMRRIMSGALVAATIGGLAQPIIVLTSTHSHFVQVVNQFVAHGSNITDAYNYILTSAAQGGLKPGNPLSQAVLAIPVGYFLFVGFTWSIYAGGEVKNPGRTQIRAVEISLLFAYVFVMITLGQYYNIAGPHFQDSATFVYNNLPSKNPFPVAPSVGLFIGLLANNPILNLIVEGSVFLYLFFSLVAIALVCVRNIFAWSFDRAFPELFARVSTRGSPWVATILTAVAAVTLLTVYEFTTFFTLTVNYIVIFSVAFLVTGITAAVFPRVRKDIFDSSPEIVKKRIGGIPLITIAGVIQVFLFALILYSSFLLPAFSGPVGPAAIAFVAGIYFTGILGFSIARAYRKRSGIDLNLLHREIPPE